MYLIDLNFVEGICCLLAILMQGGVLALRRRPIKEILLTATAITPVTLLAATAFTRFLSWDESYIFYDIVNYGPGRLTQWEMGAFRTTVTLLGPLLYFLQTLLPLTKDLVLVIAKTLHWLTGLLLITVIADQVQARFYPRVKKGVAHTLIYAALTALPVTGLALKTLNYDLLSMLFGILGGIWCIAGMRTTDKRLLFCGVLSLTLAAHEKLIASPLLWIAMVAVTVRLTLEASRSSKPVFIPALYNAVKVTLLSFGAVAVSFCFVHLTHGTSAPVFNADQLFVCWMSSVWPVVRMFGVPFMVSMMPQSLPHALQGILGRLAVIVSAVFLLSEALCTVIRIKGNRAGWVIKTSDRVVQYIPAVLLSMVTIAGIAAQYRLKVWIWPLVPVGQGACQPHMTFNGIAHHFGAASEVAHTIASMGWACAVFINALPTVLLLLLFAAAAIRARTGYGESSNRQRLPDLFTVIFLTVPLLYGALQIPLFPRYFNVFLAGIAVSGAASLLSVKQLPSGWRAGVAGGVIIIGLYAEIVPFQPIGAAFRPVWSNYSRRFNHDPGFGSVTPWYPGWGEELYQAYRKIIEEEKPGKRPICLYHNFPAALIRPPSTVVTSAMPKGHGQLPYRYGEHDYYIISRNGVSAYPYIPFPEGVPPLFTLADRGFVKAWVYRGSDLRKAGYNF
ncbi:MAG: hypothetical protein JW863_09440 [Chitinispirillaceae bacterium]|nr:hypothetical protein [Chitinispirillaceae bacterium]